jgi:hypothetical protein
MIGTRAEALERLDVFVGEWVLEAPFPGEGRSRFEWGVGRQFLLQRTEVSVPQAPSSLAIVAADLQTGAYTQHYYDSRGVVRLYAMTLGDGVWTLTREAADFTPLEFQQRYQGTFSADGNTISGAWEKRSPGGGAGVGGQWEHDFGLTYHRVAQP